MTVIHHIFGSASALPSTEPEAYVHPASTGVSSGRANCAHEIADRAHRWIDEAMAARIGLTPQQRREEALVHAQQARYCLEDPKAPLWMTVVGRHAWFARILSAED